MSTTTYSQKATAAASVAADRKLAASLSWRVATQRKSFRRPEHRLDQPAVAIAALVVAHA
jgi:hypothetical protein